LSSLDGDVFAGGLNPELLRIEREEVVRPFVTPSRRVTWVGPGKWLPPHQTGFLSPQELSAPPSAKQGRGLFPRSLRWAGENPRSALYLEARKLGYLWGFTPFWNGWSQTLLGNVPTLGLLALA